jgi:hypothetical protein
MEPLLSCRAYNRTRVSLRTSGEFSLKKYQEFPRRTPWKSSEKARWLDKEAYLARLPTATMIITGP